MKRIGVLIVDDSAVVRETIQSVLATDPAIEVIGTASDPYIAAMKMLEREPDVIILDIHMPRMDGLTFLRKIMSQHPMPVVICSQHTEKGAEETIRALEYGAVDIITKPKIGAKRFLEESQMRLCDAVKAAAQAKVRPLGRVRSIAVPPKLTADAVLRAPSKSASARRAPAVIAVGASTGGTEAIAALLRETPPESPGILVVQHMPERFTAAFARRLDSTCEITVTEALNGDVVERGHAYIAPGDRHMMLKHGERGYLLEVAEGPLVCRHRPSVDVLFRSVASAAGSNAVGVLLTGMGDDGARGMLEMHDFGAHTIAQDEESSVVWGMPAEAVKLGGVDEIMPLGHIADGVLRAGEALNVRGRSGARSVTS
jgi:two-component system chemotaxis response regulator CheB